MSDEIKRNNRNERSSMRIKLSFFTGLLCCLLAAQAAAQNETAVWNNRHHIGFVIGYAKLLRSEERRVGKECRL